METQETTEHVEQAVGPSAEPGVVTPPEPSEGSRMKMVRQAFLGLGAVVLLMVFGGLSFGAPSSTSDTDGSNKVTDDTSSKKNASTLTVHDLYDDPKQYDGHIVRVRGFYEESFEKVALSPVSGSPKQIWVSWSFSPPTAFYDHLGASRGDPILGGKVEILGLFRVVNTRSGDGGLNQRGAGHLGMYKFSLNLQEVSVYDENTQKYVTISH